MKPFLTLLFVITLSGCTALGAVSAGNCGWQAVGSDNVWTCSAITPATTKPVKE